MLVHRAVRGVAEALTDLAMGGREAVLLLESLDELEDLFLARRQVVPRLFHAPEYQRKQGASQALVGPSPGSPSARLRALSAMRDLKPPTLACEAHQLGNGLRVVLHRDRSLPLVAINLWYHAGSKNERPGKTGFAHLFEHMLFQGSAHVEDTDHFRYVQGVGGVANGSTWFDRTNYYETLPSNSLELGLWLESDRMGFLLDALSSEKLENQRQVVMNERRQRVDNQPYGKASERLSELLYPEGHPYRWPVIGYMEDIAAATLVDVQHFFSTYYVPNNAVLTLAGDFETEAALELVNRYFGSLRAGDEIPPPENTKLEATGERWEELEDNVQLPRLYLAYRLPAYGDRDWYAADLLAHVLTVGKASRFYRDLVYERELAQSVGCYALPTEECGSFQVVATCRPGTPIGDLQTALDDHLAAVAAAGIDEEELERARNRILAGYFSELQTLDRRADLLSQFTTFFDRPQDVGREAALYQQIEAKELSSVAARYLRCDNRARIHVLPAESGA